MNMTDSEKTTMQQASSKAAYWLYEAVDAVTCNSVAAKMTDDQKATMIAAMIAAAAQADATSTRDKW